MIETRPPGGICAFCGPQGAGPDRRVNRWRIWTSAAMLSLVEIDACGPCTSLHIDIRAVDAFLNPGSVGKIQW